MTSVRKASKKELRLLELLVCRAGDLKLPPNWKDNLFGSNYGRWQDGQPPSVFGRDYGRQTLFGEKVSEYEFFDADGVKVLVVLNVDKFGELFRDRQLD